MHFTYEQYHAACSPLEGRVPKMYCDIFGYVTTGVGNLINTLPEAMALPWLLADGSPADKATVAAEWHMLHDNGQHYGKLKWTVYAPQLKCHLSDDAIDDLVKRTLARNEAFYRRRWPNYDRLPADAQLAIHSMGWAVGAGFYQKFPTFAACVDREDWDAAVDNCTIRTGTPGKPDWNPGVVPRNALNKFCLHNAALVKAEAGPVETLWWPNVAPSFDAARAAQAAAQKTAADLRLAAFHALETCPYTPPGAGRSVLEYERQ